MRTNQNVYTNSQGSSNFKGFDKTPVCQWQDRCELWIISVPFNNHQTSQFCPFTHTKGLDLPIIHVELAICKIVYSRRAHQFPGKQKAQRKMYTSTHRKIEMLQRFVSSNSPLGVIGQKAVGAKQREKTARILLIKQPIPVRFGLVMILQHIEVNCPP